MPTSLTTLTWVRIQLTNTSVVGSRYLQLRNIYSICKYYRNDATLRMNVKFTTGKLKSSQFINYIMTNEVGKSEQW
jgi:hypothetical protein